MWCGRGAARAPAARESDKCHRSRNTVGGTKPGCTRFGNMGGMLNDNVIRLVRPLQV